MRIETWNIEKGCGEEKNRRRRVILDARAADVWVLTETNDSLDPRVSADDST